MRARSFNCGYARQFPSALLGCRLTSYSTIFYYIFVDGSNKVADLSTHLVDLTTFAVVDLNTI